MGTFRTDHPMLVDATTKSGLTIVGLTYVPLNGVGSTVTFPLKGTIRVPKHILTVNQYSIWTMGGSKTLPNVAQWDDSKNDDLDLSDETLELVRQFIVDNDLPYDVRHEQLWGAKALNCKKYLEPPK